MESEIFLGGGTCNESYNKQIILKDKWLPWVHMEQTLATSIDQYSSF